MKRIGNGAVWILYSVLFCLVSLGLTLVPSPQITMAQAASVCAGLNGMPIPATSIGLPTTGGLVTSTTLVPATGDGGCSHRRILQGTGRNLSSGPHCAENQVPGRPAYKLEP